jgi:antitoxin MazE
MQVSKWGNSLAIRLPAAVVEVMGLKEGDQIEVSVDGTQKLAVRRLSDADRAALLRLRALRGLIPADFKFDRLEANARGR